MLSKKRVRIQSKTQSRKLKLNNKKRVKRNSTKQRGGFKRRRRTKKSKKKSQKGGASVRTRTIQFEVQQKLP